MFTPIGDLLRTLPRRSKIPQAIVALHVRRAFGEALLAVCVDLPSDVLKTVKALNFKNHVLTISCPSLVSAELSMHSGGLIKSINNSLGKKIVFKLRFRNSH